MKIDIFELPSVFFKWTGIAYILMLIGVPVIPIAFGIGSVIGNICYQLFNKEKQ